MIDYNIVNIPDTTSLFSIITSSTLSTNIGSCGVKAHGPDQTAIAHSCENVTKALLIASPYQLKVSAREVVPHENLISCLITVVNQLTTYNIQLHLVISVHN